MSQQNQRNQGSRSAPSSGKQSSKPNQAKSGGSRQGVVRQPIDSRSGQAPQSRIDQVLPPFSTQRYIVIWLAGLVPLIAILLVLTQCNGQASQGGGQTASGCTAEGLGAGKYFTIATDKGCIVAKLHTEADAGVANTIANFESKANAGEFDGRTFHRVEDWVIQGGDPEGTGMGGGQMKSEYNQLNFAAGALGVARGPDAAINNDSQFFITKTDAPHLNGQYTNWGQVSKGMEVVNAIAIGDKMNTVRVENR